MREVVNTILYLNRSGCQWDMLPHDLLPKSTVYDYFARWRNDGTWATMWLRCGNRPGGRPARADSQRGMYRQPIGEDDRDRRRERGYDGGKKIKGRKRHCWWIRWACWWRC